MYGINFWAARSLVYALAIAGIIAPPAAGDAPDPPTRYFAQLTAPMEAAVDWESDDSRRIVAHRAGHDADVLEFGTPGNGWLTSDFQVSDEMGNLILDLRETTWVLVSVVHITESGADLVSHVYWLVETGDEGVVASVPNTGFTAPTGSDGSVETLVSFGIEQIPIEEGFNGGTYRVLFSGGSQFHVSFGTFNK